MTLYDKKVFLSSLKDLEKSARKQLQNITQIINKYESEINAEELKRKNAPKEFEYPKETSLFLHNRKPIRGIRYTLFENGDNMDDIITFLGITQDDLDHLVNNYNQIHCSLYDDKNKKTRIRKFVDTASGKELGYGDYLFESFDGNSYFIKKEEEVEDTNRFIRIDPFTKYKDDEPEIEWDKELVIPDFTHRFKNSKCAEYLCSDEDFPFGPDMYFNVYVTQFSSSNDHPSCVSFYNWYIKQFTHPIGEFFNYAFYYDYNTDDHRIYLYKTNDENEIVSVDIVNDNDYVAFIIGPYNRIKDIRIIKSEKELNRHFRKIGEV